LKVGFANQRHPPSHQQQLVLSRKSDRNRNINQWNKEQ